MYSRTLQEYVQQIGDYAQVDPSSIHLLEKTLACFITTLGRSLDATTEPQGDLLDISVRLLLLSDALSKLQVDETLDGAHYLIGLGFEQTGELITRLGTKKARELPPLLENDCWYRLLLAFFHYLAGGHRVQALSVLRHLEQVTVDLHESQYQHIRQYQDAIMALRTLYTVKKTAAKFLVGDNIWYDLFFGRVQSDNHQESHLQRLAQQIHQRRDVILANLGEDNEARWLSNRGINSNAGVFWKDYLSSLDRRGITAFTKEQVGEGSDFSWLKPGNDLLVVLPTGSGKTVIGELRSALSLSQGKQVLWMLPTRALVRQVRRELRGAFEQLDVTVEELPTTEDFIPLFAESFAQHRHVAVTTPEKLASLLRSSPEAVRDVGIVVFDEAQTLLTESRGTTAEFVLQQIRREAPLCDIVLMSASWDIKDSLEAFLLKLGRQPDLLVSDVRPTRRVYGVITNDYFGEKQYPTVLFYPPGVQEENGQTEVPFRLILDGSKCLTSRVSPTDTAQRFVRETTRVGLRTALFVKTRTSTETQAMKIARSQKQITTLPEQDVARLNIEIGGRSVVVETGKKGVACHHAGLTPLEQTMVEKWLRDGIIKTVVATPTLAQGVNLPFDLSIVTYTSRFTQDETNKPISRREILNMLGRAGRAGYVSDGFGLLSVKRRHHSTSLKVLDNSRHFFFYPQKSSEEHLGLSRLMGKALEAGIDAPDWLMELGGLSFTEGQTLIAFAVRATADADNIKEGLRTQLRLFPSIQQLDEEKVEQSVVALERLVRNIRHQVLNEDPLLVDVLQCTGMPIEVLTHFLHHLRSNDVKEMTEQEQMLWADEVVQTALESCSSRKWYFHLVEGVDLEKAFSTILLWRSGYPIAKLEANWQQEGVSSIQNRIELGRFLNHRLSLFAQFWGALAVCHERAYGFDRDPLGLLLQRLPTFIREGVSSLEQLEWLHAIGSIDRVLAHKLAEVSGLPSERAAIRRQVWIWRKGQQRLSSGLDEQYRMALSSVLNLAR